MLLRGPLCWETIPRGITIRHERQASSTHAGAHVLVGQDAVLDIQTIVVILREFPAVPVTLVLPRRAANRTMRCVVELSLRHGRRSLSGCDPVFECHPLE